MIGIICMGAGRACSEACVSSGLVVQIKQISEDYEAAQLRRMALEPEASQGPQLPRALLADVMFSLLEFKPLQQSLR